MDRTEVLEWCKLYCNNTALTDTGAFKFALDRIIEAMERIGITSESLSDMSQSFGNTEGLNIHNILSPFKKVKFV